MTRDTVPPTPAALPEYVSIETNHVHPWIPAYAGYLVGDLRTASFAELWESGRMAAYRAAHTRADWSLSPLCASCADPSP